MTTDEMRDAIDRATRQIDSECKGDPVVLDGLVAGMEAVDRLDRQFAILRVRHDRHREYLEARDDAVAWARISTAFAFDTPAHDEAQQHCYRAIEHASKLREDLDDGS